MLYNRKKITLNDLYVDIFNDGALFSQMVNPPWENDLLSSDLDIFLIGQYGQRTISPFTEMFLINGILTTERSVLLSSAILNRFSNRWGRGLVAYKTLIEDFFKDYNMTEVNTGNKNGNDTNTLQGGLTNTELLTKNTTDTTVLSSNDENKIVGFNSADYTNANKNVVTGNNTITYGGNDTKTTTKSGVDVNIREHNTDHETTIIKSGLSSARSPTQLIKENMDFFEDWDLISNICKDAVEILTLSIFN